MATILASGIDADALPAFLILYLGLMGALLLTARQCSRLREQRRRRRRDGADGMASTITDDLDEAREVFRFLEESNREMRDEVGSMRDMQAKTRKQLYAVKEAVAKVKQNKKPPVESLKDD